MTRSDAVASYVSLLLEAEYSAIQASENRFQLSERFLSQGVNALYLKTI